MRLCFPALWYFARSRAYSNMCRIVRSRRSAYEPLLLENEREAVADLLQYLESASRRP